MKKLFYTIVPFILLVVPILLGYVLSATIKLPLDSSDFVLGLYFFMLILYLTVQYIAAIRHRMYVTGVKRAWLPKVSILVVGYMEDRDYFKACIKSIDNQLYENIENIVFVNDSDTDSSKYMNNIMEECIKKNKLKMRNLSIKHNGKRHAMYRGFQEIENDDSTLILTLDSDTILAPNCVQRMVERMEEDTGAVTGHVRIFTCGSMMSFVSMLRYWFAFNIERAAQSYFGVVNCISGPLGLYRKELIKESKDLWVNQMFLGKECTYGDDRHLTYHILNRGYKVRYTHLAEAYTESPDTLTRWFKQQTRWNKSSIRETNWMVKMLNKHSFWLSLELVYILCYHLIVFGSLLYVIWGKDVFYISSWLGVIFILTFVKSIVPLCIERDFRFLLFPVYNLYFLFVFIPSKIYALITLGDTDWGTSSRFNIIPDSFMTLYPVWIWCSILLSGFLYNAIVLTKSTRLMWIFFSSVVGIYILWCGIMKIVTLNNKNPKGLNKILKMYELNISRISNT